MNICRDCAYFKPAMRFSAPSCSHPDVLAPPDPLYGCRERGNPRELRAEGGKCGAGGELFAPRTPPKPERMTKRWWQL